MGQSKSKPTKKQERCPADRYGVPMGQCGEGQCCVWKCKDGNFDYANNTRCADGRHDTPRNDPRWSYLDKTTSRATSSGEMPQSFEALARNMTTAYETDFRNAGAFYADWAVATDNWGGGNWEYEAYEPKAVSVGGSNGLVITATVGSTKQNVGTQADGSPMKYQAAVTSGKVQLKRTGIPSGACSFRCRFTPGKGLWPACWMLPLWNGKPVGIGQGFEPGDPEWPATGEIDVMEGKGSTPRWTVQTFHYGRDWNHWGYTNVESDESSTTSRVPAPSWLASVSWSTQPLRRLDSPAAEVISREY